MYTDEEIVEITWYLTSPYTTTFGTNRYNSLPDGGTPNAHFDYYIDEVGGFASGSMIDYYTPHVNSQLSDPSPLNMIASYAINGTDVSVNVDISVDQTVTTTNNYIYFVVIEDDVHNHDNIARTVLAEEPLTALAVGEEQSVSRNFSLDPSWKEDDIEIICFVQTLGGNRKILQASKAYANYVGSIIVEVQPAGLGAGWTITGPDGYNAVGIDGRVLAVFAEGDYTITFDDVVGWTEPDPIQLTDSVVTDGEVTFSAVYTGGPFTGIMDGPLGNAGNGRGAAMIDFDGDGDLDIHVVNYGEPDQLLRNDGGNVFVDVAAGAIADAGNGMAAAWADFDNDGDLDAYLSKDNEANILLRNDGGVFVNANFSTAIGDTGPGRGIAWNDYDLDGQVDVYVCNEGAANVLLQSYGPVGADWLFLSQSSGVDDAGNSWCPVWTDFDNDGDADLFFTTRSGSDRLFENGLGLGFAPFSSSAINNLGLGAGADWADYDDDGDFDLYAAVEGSSDRLVRNYSGNSFAPVIGTLPFTSVANTRGLGWADFDNDGDLDLYQAKAGQFDRLERNEGGNVFVEIPLGMDLTGGDARAIVWGDTDGDGDQDVFLVNENGPNALLRNDQAEGNNWVHLRLQGVTSNAAAIGARVELTVAGKTMTREVRSGSGYLAQHSLDVEFGLGTATAIEDLVITWPSGTVQNFSALPINQVVVIPENATTAVGEGEESPQVVRLHRAFPNPFNPSTKVAFDLPREGRVLLAVYDVAGRRVKVLADDVMPAGTHESTWLGDDAAGRPVAAGTYLLRLEAADTVDVQRLTLVK